MTLLDLLSAMCFVSPISIAIATAKHDKVEISGYAIALAVGLAIAVAAVYLMHRLNSLICRQLPEQLGSWFDRCFFALYLTAMLAWIILADALAGSAASVAIRLVH